MGGAMKELNSTVNDSLTAQKAEQQEPVCSVCCKPHDKDNPVGYFYPPANELDSWEQAAAGDDPDAVPLYTAPLQRKEWVEPSDEQIKAICAKWYILTGAIHDALKLAKELNCGQRD